MEKSRGNRMMGLMHWVKTTLAEFEPADWCVFGFVVLLLLLSVIKTIALAV